MQLDSDGAVDIGAGYPPTESTTGADLVGSREEALDRIEDLEAEYPGLIEDLAGRHNDPIPEFRAPMFGGGGMVSGGSGGNSGGPKRNGWFRRLVRFLARLLSELGAAIERALGVDE